MRGGRAGTGSVRVVGVAGLVRVVRVRGTVGVAGMRGPVGVASLVGSAGLVGAACLLAGCAAGGVASIGTESTTPSSVGPASTAAASAQHGLVTHVVDGDTVEVAGVGRIRVIGIDTPERGACGYESATLAMSALVAGREVVLTPGATSDADRYGRLLRYVDVDGGADAGLSLIEDGWAVARYDSRDGYGAHPRERQYVAADLAAPDRGCYDEDE